MATMSKAAARRKDKLSKKINKANIKGKTKRATRLAKRQAKIVKTGKTGAGRAIQKVKNTADKIKKKVDKIKGSKLGKIATAAASTVSAIKKGKIDKAIKGVADTAKAVTSKRSYPKKEKKVKMVGTKKPKLVRKPSDTKKTIRKVKKQVRSNTKKKKPTISNLDYNTNRKKYEAYMKELNEFNKSTKKPKMAMQKPMLSGVIKPMLAGKKKTSKLSRLDRKSARKAAAAQRKGAKLHKMQAERDKLARGLYDKLGRKDYYSKVKGDPSSLSSKDKRTIRKINRLYKSEGRKDRAINRKVRKINKVAKKQGSPKRIGRQSGDPLNNYKPYKR